MSQEAMNQLRAWMAEQGLDAYMVTQPQNRSYLSGWLNDDVEGAGLLLVGRQQQILFTNPLYKEVVEDEAQGWQVNVPPSREYWAAIATSAQEHGWQNIGFESAALTFAEYEKLRRSGESIFTLHPFEDSYIEKLRQVKQPHEIELLKRAIAITDETFTHLCSWIQPAMTEKETQWEIMVSHLIRSSLLDRTVQCRMHIPVSGVFNVVSSLLLIWALVTKDIARI
ncbi:MAG: hypothetical protein E6J04_01475 [Chloroflexi bacterium]|nr:MAG: hypothetical protein E6J04_01475 [Chloroflexota bacterium]